MPTTLLTPNQKKLRSLRKILWIIFAAITITILLVSSLTLPAALLINKTSDLGSLAMGETGLVLLSVLALVLVKIAAGGILCLVVYLIFRYRLEKDEDLFL